MPLATNLRVARLRPSRVRPVSPGASALLARPVRRPVDCRALDPLGSWDALRRPAPLLR